MKFKVDDNKTRSWFAWYPVTAWDHKEQARRVVWLETVMRARVGFHWCRYYQYSINTEHSWYNKKGFTK